MDKSKIVNKILEQKYRKDPTYIKHGDGFSVKENGLIKFFYDGKEVESIIVDDGFTVWEVKKIWDKNEWKRNWEVKSIKEW